MFFNVFRKNKKKIRLKKHANKNFDETDITQNLGYYIVSEIEFSTVEEIDCQKRSILYSSGWACKAIFNDETSVFQ